MRKFLAGALGALAMACAGQAGAAVLFEDSGIVGPAHTGNGYFHAEVWPMYTGVNNSVSRHFVVKVTFSEPLELFMVASGIASWDAVALPGAIVTGDPSTGNEGNWHASCANLFGTSLECRFSMTATAEYNESGYSGMWSGPTLHTTDQSGVSLSWSSSYWVPEGDDWTPPTYSIRVEEEFFAPVPEPATWALMIAGFGATGLALRRRRPLAV